MQSAGYDRNDNVQKRPEYLFGGWRSLKRLVSAEDDKKKGPTSAHSRWMPYTTTPGSDRELIRRNIGARHRR